LRSSQKVALIAVFAALHAVLFLPEGPWRSFVIYLTPIEGIVLGPYIGFAAALLGSTTARLVKPNVFWMFGIVAEPTGALAAGFLAKGKWKQVLLAYVVMLAAYFAHPYGRLLPLWTILDLLAAFLLVYPTAKLGKNLWNNEGRPELFAVALLLIAFVTTVLDSLTRVFILIPMNGYQLFGYDYQALAYEWFIPGAVGSYIEDVLVCIMTTIAGVPVLTSLKKTLQLKRPLS
jgi:hypothetical protein